MRLKRNEYLPFAPATEGVERINHVSPHCKGESKSMKIERAVDGKVSAKCFRCGAWGVDTSDCGTPDAIRATMAASLETGSGTEDKGRRLGELEGDVALWPLLAHNWIRQYGISNAEIIDYGIMYAVERSRVYLPVWWKGDKVGYQLRKIYDTDEGPKYDSRVRGGLGFMSYNYDTSNEIVIVEDILSAIKVGRQVPAMALLSTSLTNTVKSVLANYDRFHIWLDMDNPQVIRQAVKLLKTLELFGETKLVQTMKDPKVYSDEEIKRILYVT